jgi:isopenicillin N synthase-like dioxygenase
MSLRQSVLVLWDVEMAMDALPIINIAPFVHGDAAARRAVVDDVDRACAEIGFFILAGHGVAPDVIDRLYDAARGFFDLPAAAKARVGETGNERGGLMHFPFAQERLAATLGADTPADLKQSLDFGPGFWGDEWPKAPIDLESACLDYFEALSGLAARLRRLFMAAVGMPEDYLDDFFDHHSTIRVNDYPDQTAAPQAAQLRAGVHTDYGFVTILRSEDAPGGLQVQNRAGRWLDVPAVPDAFVVNIGDAMMRWTNDHWISTPHRVVNPPLDAAGSTRRQSIAFFHNPNRDAVIQCLPPFRTSDCETKYPAITYGEYAEQRYKQAHGADKTLGLDTRPPV